MNETIELEGFAFIEDDIHIKRRRLEKGVVMMRGAESSRLEILVNGGGQG